MTGRDHDERATLLADDGDIIKPYGEDTTEAFVQRRQEGRVRAVRPKRVAHSMDGSYDKKSSNGNSTHSDILLEDAFFNPKQLYHCIKREMCGPKLLLKREMRARRSSTTTAAAPRK